MVSTSNPENYEMLKLAIFSTLMYLVNNYKKDFPDSLVCEVKIRFEVRKLGVSEQKCPVRDGTFLLVSPCVVIMGTYHPYPKQISVL